MRQLDGKPSVGFKKEMSNIELAGIEHILEDVALNQQVGLNTLPDSMGLVYTSSNGNRSNMYAMYQVTEDVGYRHLPADEDDLSPSEYYKVEGFVITPNNMLLMVTSKWSEPDTWVFFEIQEHDTY